MKLIITVLILFSLQINFTFSQNFNYYPEFVRKDDIGKNQITNPYNTGEKSIINQVDNTLKNSVYKQDIFGYTYIGQVENGVRSGFGTLVNLFQDTIYKGIWKDDMPYQGQFYQFNYENKCFGNCENGVGLKIINDVCVYRGGFKDGKWEGKGEYIFIPRYDDSYNIYMTSTYTNGEEGLDRKSFTLNAIKTENNNLIINKFYNGDIFFYSKKEEQDGSHKALRLFNNGSIFSGYLTDNGNKKGTVYYKNGDIFIGSSIYIGDNNEKSGIWTKLNSNGTYDIYIGQFINSQLNGIGSVTYANGQIKEGLFENGKFIKSNVQTEEDEINNEKVNSQTTGTYVVSRDNILYKTVTINGITWMAENLRSVTFRNGDNILEAKTKDDLIRYNNIKMPCYVKKLNTDANGIAGDLTYNWYAISDFRGLAPIGFHISTNSEWDNLIDYCGGPVSASTKLKSSSGYPITPSGEIEIMKACPNCINWNSEYRSKVACHGCKDKRELYDYTKKIPSINYNGSNALGFNWQYGSKYVSIDEESATHADGGFLDARGPLLFMGCVIRNQFSCVPGDNIMQVNVRCVKD